MVDVRAKGAKAESDARDLLRKHTKLGWERTPGSGALNEKHFLKGDLYVPNEKNLYAVECKHYAEDHISSQILTSRKSQLIEWWEQTKRQAEQMSRKPLLIFKFNRSKFFAAYEDMPLEQEFRWMLVNWSPHEFFMSSLEEWLIHDKPNFIEGQK